MIRITSLGWLSMVVIAGCGDMGESTTTPPPAITSNGPGGDSGASGGPGGTGGGAPDPFQAAAACTSGTTWTRGDAGSSHMNPGRVCIACHSTNDGPTLAIAGTVYPTAHEPDLCYGEDGANGVAVVITGADGQTLTLTPGSSGNFDWGGSVAFPYRAKVTYMGRERAMSGMQTTGDCNGCHTQTGANGAPGRILLP